MFVTTSYIKLNNNFIWNKRKYIKWTNNVTISYNIFVYDNNLIVKNPWFYVIKKHFEMSDKFEKFSFLKKITLLEKCAREDQISQHKHLE